MARTFGIASTERIEIKGTGRAAMPRRMVREDMGRARAPMLTTERLAAFDEAGIDVVTTPNGMRYAGQWRDAGPGF